MRKIIFLIVAATLWACSEKSEEITPSIKCENLYAIQDNPSDTVQHWIYEIYQKYGVSVYFNDTIAKNFEQVDINGDSVFRYETIDLNWGFHSYGAWDYSFDYMKDQESQLTGLKIVEEFLEIADKVLYPHAILIANYGQRENSRVTENCSKGDLWTNFRSLFLSGGWSESELQSVPENILKTLIKKKIQNYPDDLVAFEKVSDKNWYGGVLWTSISATAANLVFPNPYDELGIQYTNPLSFTYDVLLDKWVGLEWWTGTNPFGLTLPQEELDRLKKGVRDAVGELGFISANRLAGGKFAPMSTADDLEDYIDKMLNYSKEDFKAIWGAYPLVMKKYNIIYNVILERLGVEL